MFKLLIIFLIFLSCNDETLGSGAPDLDINRGSVETGLEIFTNNCIDCHGEDANGQDSLTGENLDGSDITNVSINRLYDVLTFDDVVPAMRDFVGQYRDEDIEDIAAYLLTFQNTIVQAKRKKVK